MRLSQGKIFSAISLVFFVFLLLLITDITPYVRGPIDPILPSRWPYYFINTFAKIWAPGLVVFLFFSSFYYFFDKVLNKKKEILFLMSLVLIIFLFQISLVFFSRFGINVLFRRMADPGINGYFSTAVRVKDINSYLKNFPNVVAYLDQHGRGHPPGSILAIKEVIYFFDNNKTLTKIIYSHIPKPTGEALKLWNNLTISQRVSSVMIPFLLHFLAAFSIVPFYFAAKNLFNQKTAIRSVFLYSAIPSLSFFALLFDPVYSFFPLISFLFLLKFFKTKKILYAFFSGLIFGLGLFFSVSIIPYMGIMFFYTLLSVKKSSVLLIPFLIWLLGFLIFLLLPLLFSYNSITSIAAVVKHQLPREYLIWVFFNPYDFFMFMGVPISLLFFYSTFCSLRIKGKDFLQKNALLISFWIVFLLLVILGISRGEVGRIWLSLMSIPVFLVSQFTLRINLNKKYFSILLLLVFLQVIAMEEFWVPIW